jgi:two-component system sensor histidine kinase MtrB
VTLVEPPSDEPTSDSSRGRVALRALRTGLQRVIDTWRHSLNLRVGATTVIATGVVMIVLGLLVVDQVAAGVLKAKKDAAISQVRGARPAAKAVLSPVYVNVQADVQNAVKQVQSDATGNASAGGLFTLEIIPPSSPKPDVPPALRALVQQNRLALAYALIPKAAGSDARVKGLIVGETIEAQGGDFELYYLFPLTAEADTISLVQRTVLIAGLALVLLVLVIALLVTRQVVAPVRVAARAAGELAAGDLTRRVPVRGSDDIARLGRSFNDMAGSLQRQIRRLEDLSRLQRRFTSDVSHELRTPLTTIRMASELLHAGRDDFTPELARSAELLQSELDKFESLLGDLLEISRYDAGVARLESETADLRGVVGAAVSANAVLAERQGSAIDVITPDEPVPVDMDSRRVERILRNLIGNALDHGEGRRIEVTVAADRDAAAVTVRDHGIGLRPGEAGLVFNRFWRGDPSRSRLTGGTGLGLAISLEDARLHDGWLQAWGVRGHGAQFRLTLPRQAGHTLMGSPLPLVPADVDEEDT